MPNSTVRLPDNAAKVWPDIPARSILIHGADEFAALGVDLGDVVVAGFDPNRSAGGVEQRRPCRKQRDCQIESAQPSEGMVCLAEPPLGCLPCARRVDLATATYS